jgi:hypothetical protein
MPDERDDFDVELQRRLAASESRIPASLPPLNSPPARSRWAAPLLIAGTALAAVAIAVVALQPILERRAGSATPTPDAGVTAEARSGDLVLTLSSPRSVWTTGDAIEIVATISLAGVAEQVDLRGGSGPIVFRLRQLSGGDATAGGGQDLPCITYPISRDTPLVVPFQKAGSSEDPFFDQTWLLDPVLRLPIGRWEAHAQFRGHVGGCSDETKGTEPIELGAAIEIEVIAAGSSEEPSVTASPTPSIEPTSTVKPTPSASGQACMDAMTGGILGADAERHPLVRFEDGPPFRVDLSHLDDFIRIETEPVLTIYNRRGDTIATEGDFVELTGGFNADGTVFHACGITRPPTGDRR